MVTEKSGSESEVKFDGIDGITCHEFIQAIRKHAFDEGKSNDNKWMAEIASFRFSGSALKWFEELDDATQEEWKLLKRALLRQYAEPSYEAATRDLDVPSDATPRELIFEGKDEKEAEIFVLFVRRQAFQSEKSEDDKWMANFAATHLLGVALRWHSELSQSTRSSWKFLERVILETFSSNIETVGLNAKRISIAQWNTVVRASSLRFPKSEEEWLERGRRRRADMNLPISWKVTWSLVEHGETIPFNAIPISPENGNLFSIRAWHEGGLTIGKYVRSLTQSYIPWYGKEVIHNGPFEVLVGDSGAVRWVSPKKDAFAAVEGGFEVAFEPALLVARAKEGHGWTPGKVFSGGYRAYFGMYWKERIQPIEEVEVLAWDATI